MKNKELDLLIVVNMFLTGFDASTPNTLWVDKNLKMHGLIQAFSRTNRILNSVKTFGKEVFIIIRKAIDASPELRSKKQLIEAFIAGINEVDDVMNGWNEYVYEQRESDLNQIIKEEKSETGRDT